MWAFVDNVKEPHRIHICMIGLSEIEMGIKNFTTGECRDINLTLQIFIGSPITNYSINMRI